MSVTDYCLEDRPWWDFEWYLEELKKVKPQKYKYKDDDDLIKYVLENNDEIIAGQKDGFWGYTYCPWNCGHRMNRVLRDACAIGRAYKLGLHYMKVYVSELEYKYMVEQKELGRFFPIKIVINENVPVYREILAVCSEDVLCSASEVVA